MKLASSYNRVTLLAALIILLVTGFIYYEAISYFLTRQLDKELKVEEQEINTEVKARKKIPQSTYYKDQQISYTPDVRQVPRSFSSLDYQSGHELEPGRRLLTNVQLDGKNYQVSIIFSRVESEDLIQTIFLITLTTAVITLLSLYLINRLILGKLWRPFYVTLAEIRNFQVQHSSAFTYTHSSIDEFSELNQAVQSMASRVKDEFSDLRIFTENAAHELMTPIAVMRSKLDTLIQTETMNKEQTELVTDLYEGISRLTRINHSLLLLVKIDNKLLQDIELIPFAGFIEQKIRQFNELIIARGLGVKTSLSQVNLYMSRYLADILLNNLISNAINHTGKDGDIVVLLTPEELVFSNPSADGLALTEKVFGRFQKGPASDGTGLGLTIVRQICLALDFKLGYTFNQGRHVFTISFPGELKVINQG